MTMNLLITDLGKETAISFNGYGECPISAYCMAEIESAYMDIVADMHLHNNYNFEPADFRIVSENGECTMFAEMPFYEVVKLLGMCTVDSDCIKYSVSMYF